MTQGKHTQGPWTVVASTPSLVEDHGGTVFVQVTDRVPGLSTFDLRMEETRANARLIATAPEMLEALRDALGAIRSASRALSEEHKLALGGKPWGGRDIAAIEAVIAKAEGW